MITNQDEDDYIAEGKSRKKQRKRRLQTLKHNVLFSVLVIFIGLCSCSVHSFSNSRSSSLIRSSSFSHTEPSNMMSPSFSSIQHGYCAGGGDGIHRQSVRVGLFPNGATCRDGKKRWKTRSTRMGQSFKNLMSDIRKKTHSLLLWKRKGSLSALVAAAIFFSNSLSSSVTTQEITNFDYVSDVHHKVIDDNGAASIEKYMSVNRGGQKLSSDGNELQRFVAKSRSAFQVSKKSKSVTPIPMASVIKTKAVKKTLTSEGEALIDETTKTFQNAITDLSKYMQGPKSDTLLLLLSTALITPLCKRIGTSPILGFLAAGMVLGPNALGLISGIHTTETLAELGIVFFLFEMGIELSYDRLKSMKKDVFGLGLCQFSITAAVIAAVGSLFGIPANALVVLGGGLALSSSAFVLQLLKDNNQLATRFGKASFGVLLFQDLAVVPLLVVTPILAGGGQGLATAVGSAALKATMALGSIAFAGRVILNPLFKLVAQSNSQEAFLGVVLLTVLSMSFMTEGLGLSNTLGAFLAGVLLSETKYRYQIEADIAPFRGILLGLFFVTVGFEIDFTLIASNLPLVSSIVAGIILIKSTVLTLLGLAGGLSFATAQQTALLLSQGGEFAFVAFGLARNLGILDPATTKLMLTSVALTMAVTPFLAEAGAKISKKLEEGTDFTHYLGQADRDANEIKNDDFVVVAGYGTVGKVVCDLLDRKFIRYVGLELSPSKAIEARNKGLPVYYGDIGRPEVTEAMGVGKAKAIIVTIADKDFTNRAVISLRRTFPDMKIFARAKDAEHAERLQNTLDVVAMVPVVPEDNVLLTLPFGGAVLRSLGAAKEEVNAILEAKRKEILSGRGLDVDEEKNVLAQFGILEHKEEVSPGNESSEEQTLSKAAFEIAEKKKATNPMVAEAIEANLGVGTSKVITPSVVDAEILDSNEGSNEKIEEET